VAESSQNHLRNQLHSVYFPHKGIWVEPKLLAEIEYRAKSPEGKVRHPFFRACGRNTAKICQPQLSRRGHILVPSASGAVGDQIRVRILATDVSLARERPGRSSILNVLPAQIVAMNALNAYEVLAAVALGEDGAGARLLARVPQKSWEELGFARGQNVFAQVKSVALGRADAE
jgi:molybdopterin-binding protein